MKRLLNYRNSSVISAAFIIMTTYGLSSLLGVVRNRLLASNFFGSEVWKLDVYFASFTIPDAVFQLLVIGALSAAFIPVFSQYYKKSHKSGWELASTAIHLIILVFLSFSLAIFFLAKPLSQLIAPEYSPEQIALMTRLTRIMLLAQFFFAISSFLTGVLQSQQRFVVPAIAPVLYNLGIILGTVVLSPHLSIYGPAIGVVVGAFWHFLIQLPFVINLGFKYRPVLKLNHPGIKKIRRLMVPRALALATGQVENFLAVAITASLMVGSLTMFKFARQLYLLPITLFGVTFSQAAFPALADQSGKKGKKNFKKIFSQALRQVVFFSLPASIMLLVLRIPLVRIAFGAKSFPWPATILTGKVVAIFSFSIVTQAVSQLIIRAFYALHDTKTPFFVSLTTALLNVFFSWFLVFKLGMDVRGLALSATLSSFIHASLLLKVLYERLDGFDGGQLFNQLAQMFFSGFLTSIFLWAPMRIIDRFVIDTTRTLGLIILVLIVLFFGASAYIFCSWIFKVEELEVLKRFAWKLFNLKKTFSTKVEVEETSTIPPSADQ